MLLTSFIFLTLAFIFFSSRRLLTYLHIFQQEDYIPTRLIRWIRTTRTYDIRASLCVFLLSFPAVLRPDFAPLFNCVAAITLIAVALLERDPRKVAKKKLILTARATRTYVAACAYAIAMALTLYVIGAPLPFWIIAIQCIPLTLCLGDYTLKPWESTVQRKYWQEAHDKLLHLKTFTIGITGSFGKTSTKHILAHVLSQYAPTLTTPGSVNTPMGIARVVREHLTPHHQYFICEMGAYGEGSIQRLCDLAPPSAGIITTIGHAHYERYKSLETVARAKFELAENVAKNQGFTVISSGTLTHTHAQEFVNEHRNNITLVGTNETDDAKIIETGQNHTGIYAQVKWREQTYVLRAPLFGTHHIGNMVQAFATACKLGMDPNAAITALATTPQIRHRLEVIRQPSGAIIIDDAYNANPAGFKAALEVLSLLGQDRRKILISPGIVELGSAHDSEHKKIGELAAQHADVFLPVAGHRIPSMVTAFKFNAPHKDIHPCDTFKAAENWLADHMRHNDIILLANDLPDLYERKLVL